MNEPRTCVALVKRALAPGLPTGLDAAGQLSAEESFPIMEPSAIAALSVARRVSGPLGTVIALSVGGPLVQDVLRRALELGADRAIRVDVARWRHLPASAVATALTKAIRRSVGHVDLIVCGDRSIDEGTGEVGPRIAHTLGLPWTNAVASVQVEEDGSLILLRRRPRGERLEVHATLPAVLCLDPTPVPAEPVTAAVAIAAATAPIEILALPPLAREPALPLRRLRPRVLPLTIPRQDLPADQRIWSMFWGGEARREGAVYTLPPEETARRILDLLDQRGLLG
jgi:electron transfer flavoprotein beta subunit